jgi:hypothetical protein
MEGMALHESSYGKPATFPYPETLNRYGGIGRARGIKTAARSKKDGKRMLVEIDESDDGPI